MTQSAQKRQLPPGVMLRAQRTDDENDVIHIWHVRNPDLPRITVEEYRGLLAVLPPGTGLHRMVAERQGQVVGSGMALQKFWVANPGSTDISLSVLPEHQNQGIGAALYDELFQAALDFGTERFFSEVRENHPVGLSFAHNRGFERTEHVTRLSRLEIASAQYDGYDGLEERMREAGISVTTLAQLGPDDDNVLREWHNVEVETAKDEPTTEAYSVSFEVWRDSVMKQPGVSPESTFAAIHDGKIVGVTKVQREGEDAGWHAGMGVLREFRGRGVARLLKWHSIQWSRDNGINFLYTGNDKHNPRMYAINQRLGYTPLPGTVELVRSA